ncbi:MAG: helix-turn-helix transcriptional regulator [bacterium]|nr:helix-turn-helix transcriptional regulator [bacterium]
MQQADKINLENLGKRIRELRKLRSPSLNRFVYSKGGLTTATWSRIENGKFDAKFSTLVKVSAMLGIKIEDLLKDLNLNYSLEEN